MDINYLENEAGYTEAKIIKELSGKLDKIEKVIKSMDNTDYMVSVGHLENRIPFENTEKIYYKILKSLKEERQITLKLLKKRITNYGEEVRDTVS